MGIVKSILRYIAIFIIAAAVMITLFLLVALIPRERIQANMEESAEYLQQKGAAFPNTVLGLNCSKADYYADAVLLISHTTWIRTILRNLYHGRITTVRMHLTGMAW